MLKPKGYERIVSQFFHKGLDLSPKYSTLRKQYASSLLNFDFKGVSPFRKPLEPSPTGKMQAHAQKIDFEFNFILIIKMFNRLKQKLSNYFTGVTLLRDSENPCLIPKVYLSDASYAQDPRNIEDWQNLGIGLIINVTTEDPAVDEIQQIYWDLGIQYLWVPIRDNYENIPVGYLSDIVNYVETWTSTSTSDASSIDWPMYAASISESDNLPTCRDNPNILIHCSAGVNRSALVAAAILWYTTPNREKIWPTPDTLIDYMRQRQFTDRGTFLLSNTSFYNYLIDFLK